MRLPGPKQNEETEPFVIASGEYGFLPTESYLRGCKSFVSSCHHPNQVSDWTMVLFASTSRWCWMRDSL